MNKLFLICVCVCFIFASCSNHESNRKLLGKWRSQTAGYNVLNVTAKQFYLDSPEPEDYFVKGDTIYTSFEGNLPYTKYAIKKVDDHQLVIFTPDSTTLHFVK